MASDISSVTNEMMHTIQAANKAFEFVWSSIANTAKEINAPNVLEYASRKTISYNPNNPDIFQTEPELKPGTQIICDIMTSNLHEVNSNANNSASWMILGHCYLMISDYANAYSSFSHVLRINNQIQDPYFWYSFGCVYQHFKYYDDALKFFLNAKEITKNPALAPDYHLRLAFIYRAKKMFPNAYAELDAVLNNPPPNLKPDDIVFQRAFTLLLEGQTDLSLQEFKRLVNKYPNNLKVLQQYTWILSFRDDKASLNELQVVISSHPEFDKDPLLKFILARIELNNSNMESAYKKYCDIIVDWCDSALFWCELGVLYCKNEQYQDAIVAFQRAIYQKAQIPEAWLNFGLILEKHHDLDSAKRLYETGKQTCENSQKIQERLDKLIKGQRNNVNDEQPEEIRDPRFFQQIGDIQELGINRTPPKIPTSCVTANKELAKQIETLSMNYESLFEA
ncbi:cellular component assembly [Trichomonas vaginalis G3]|uniref:cellular component assembly n=1 Tax=Trichomonas vaginalis (strain ATCC PRA-98 / G3) TaxID=412133 RepID=UPI0021E5ABA8|nr:cellular component assembly [Trichomonas vaginalis G3]KAI5484764.1 cellular component assembly [Trichomonas vaginalis G3]